MCLFVSICACACVHIPRHTCGGHRIHGGVSFSFSYVSPGIEVRLSVLAASSLSTEPSCWPISTLLKRLIIFSPLCLIEAGFFVLNILYIKVLSDI